jgi:hypothetical protein
MFAWCAKWLLIGSAAALGVGRTTLFQQLKALGISVPAGRQFTKFTAFTELSRTE